MGLKGKLPLLNSENEKLRMVGYVAYIVIGLLVVMFILSLL